MLLSKTVVVKWNGFTRKWYEDKGYLWTHVNDLFECKIEDVQVNSTVKVEARCDYCGEIYHPEYRQMLNARKIINKDCCSNRRCMSLKSKEVNLIIYGVENHMQLTSSQEKARKREQTPFNIVQKSFIDKNLELLSQESDYLNDRSRLFFICKLHENMGVQETNYANIKKNKGCCNFGKGELCAKSSKLDGYIVYQAFLNETLIPQFKPDEYKKYSQPLPYLCPKHIDKGIQYRSYASLKTAKHMCDFCLREYMPDLIRTEESVVFNYFNQRGLTILNGENYKNKDQNIKYTCNKHPEFIQQVSYAGLKNTKQPCDYCRAEESLGKLNRTLRSSLSKWRKESRKVCKNKCILTGSKNYDVHHLYTFNNIVLNILNEMNIDIKNKYTACEFLQIKEKVIDYHNNNLGVCIDRNLHILYHQLYSKDNNSVEQFEEFKLRLKSGEFKEILNTNNLSLII